MIRTVLLNRHTGQRQKGDASQITIWKEQKDTLIWIDLIDPDELEDKLIAEQFNFNALEMT